MKKTPKPWQHRWEKTDLNITSGAQALASCVREKSKPGDSTRYFLKELKQNDKLNRRKRMYSESAAYQTIVHPSVPRLIDDNTAEFNNLDVPLYLVTEFIEGVTLESWMETNALPLPLDDALAHTLELLEVVQHCHASEVLHRDIKHDNILLKNSNIRTPVLLDFGLSFNRETPKSTTLGTEELGNRFLRLPELGANSSNKHDKKSDVTFVCGILFYLLTHELPSQLRDGDLNAPHQRESARKRLLTYGIRSKALLGIFDKGFQYNPNNRWPSSESLIAALTLVPSYEGNGSSNLPEERMLQDARDAVASAQSEELAQIKKTLQSGTRALDASVGAVIQRLNLEGLELSRGDEAFYPEKLFATLSLGARLAASHQGIFMRYIVRIVGAELIISLIENGAEHELGRADSGSPVFGDTFDVAISESLLSRFTAGVTAGSGRQFP